MKLESVVVIFTLCIISYGFANTVRFTDKVGTSPSGWLTGVTGSGEAKWSIEADASAPDKSNVLKQSGVGTFPWCVKEDVALIDGFVEVKFKAIAGEKDQAGGVIWRFQDGNNYYVARANALENNVSLYYTENGKRITIQYVAAPVAKNQWHTLRATFNSKRIQIALDGVIYIDVEDEHILAKGKIGVWTKADSVTSFNEFSYDSSEAK